MSYILELKNQFSNYEVIVGETEELDYDRSLFNKFNDIMNKIYSNNKLYDIHTKHKILNKAQHLSNKNNNFVNYKKIILDRLNIINENYILIKSDKKIDKYILYDSNKIEINKKSKVNTLTLLNSKSFYNFDRKEREILLQKYIIIILYNLNKILEKNGNLTLRIYNFYNNYTYFLIILLLKHFKYGYFLYGTHLYLCGFKQNVNNFIIKKIFNNNIIFKFNNNIENKINYIINYVNYVINFKIERSIYILYNDLENLNNIITNYNLSILLDLSLFDKLYLININNLLFNFYKNINFKLINLYNKFIKKYNLNNIIEIGSSEGIIPLFLLNNNNNIFITSIYKNKIIYDNILLFLNKFIKLKKFFLIKKISSKKKYNFIIIYFTNNYNENIKNINLSFKLVKKNSIISINYSNCKNINIYLKHFIKYKILYKSLDYVIFKKNI